MNETKLVSPLRSKTHYDAYLFPSEYEMKKIKKSICQKTKGISSVNHCSLLSKIAN